MVKLKFAVSKAAKSLIATIIIAIVVFTSTSQLEVKAQWTSPVMEVSEAYVHIGRNAPINAGFNPFLTFGQGNSSSNQGQWYMGAVGTGFSIGKIYNVTSVTASERSVFIQNDGTVGINHWAPDGASSCKLDVYGRIRATNSTILTSDRRYKRDIKPINNLDNLFKINSVQYKSSDEALREKLQLFKQKNEYILDEQNLKSAISDFETKISERNADTTTYFGFIAQELREIYPNLVFEDTQGYLSVDYTGLIPVLVEAIKELNAKVEKLEGKNREVMPSNISSAVLYQNNPNPFSERTEIKFYVPENSSNAFICIYDMVGSQLMKLDVNAGYSSIFVNGSQLKAGMYLYSLIVDGKEIDTKRMILTDN